MILYARPLRDDFFALCGKLVSFIERYMTVIIIINETLVYRLIEDPSFPQSAIKSSLSGLTYTILCSHLY